MHILLVADGRSPITRRWAQGVAACGHRLTLVSTYPCGEVPGVEEIAVLPVAFGALGGSQVGSRGVGSAPSSGLRKLLGRFRALVVAGRYLLGPASLPFYGRRFRKLVQVAQPDLVHALRIPFEGMLASYSPPEVPLVLSIWGNDLTLHARRSRAMRRWTERVLQRADGLAADAQRDINLARAWGFDPNRPVLVVPGGGGIKLAEMRLVKPDPNFRSALPPDLPASAPLVINPRGFRPGSIRSEVFFQAVPLVLRQEPEVRFLCPGMAGQVEAQRWVKGLKIDAQVRLLPYLPQEQLWDLFRRAAVTVSVSVHDGTPNSLLEAMACGCFPVVGDIESLREWITPGVNGLLVDPGSPQALAEAVLLAIGSPELRERASEENMRLIAARAEVGLVSEQVEGFYQRVNEYKHE